MIKLTDLIKGLKEIDFKNQDAFKKYKSKHKMRGSTKVNIAGKDTTVDQASGDEKMSDTEKEMDTAAKYANVKMDRGEALDIINKGKLTPDNMQDTFNMIKNYADWMGYEDELADFEDELEDIIDDGDVDTFESYAEELLDPDKKEKDMGKTLAQMDYEDEDSPESYYDDEDDDDVGGPAHPNVPKGAKSSKDAKKKKSKKETIIKLKDLLGKK